MVELAVHQKPLHQVDVFLAGGTGAAERAAPDFCNRFYTCRLARLVRGTRTSLIAGRGQGERRQGKGGKWRVMGEEGGRSNTESGFEDMDCSF